MLNILGIVPTCTSTYFGDHGTAPPTPPPPQRSSTLYRTLSRIATRRWAATPVLVRLLGTSLQRDAFHLHSVVPHTCRTPDPRIPASSHALLTPRLDSVPFVGARSMAEAMPHFHGIDNYTVTAHEDRQSHANHSVCTWSDAFVRCASSYYLVSVPTPLRAVGTRVCVRACAERLCGLHWPP